MCSVSVTLAASHTLKSLREFDVNTCADAMFMLSGRLSARRLMCTIQAASPQDSLALLGQFQEKSSTFRAAADVLLTRSTNDMNISWNNLYNERLRRISSQWHMKQTRQAWLSKQSVILFPMELEGLRPRPATGSLPGYQPLRRPEDFHFNVPDKSVF